MSVHGKHSVMISPYLNSILREFGTNSFFFSNFRNCELFHSKFHVTLWPKACGTAVPEVLDKCRKSSLSPDTYLEKLRQDHRGQRIWCCKGLNWTHSLAKELVLFVISTALKISTFGLLIACSIWNFL